MLLISWLSQFVCLISRICGFQPYFQPNFVVCAKIRLIRISAEKNGSASRIRWKIRLMGLIRAWRWRRAAWVIMMHQTAAQVTKEREPTFITLHYIILYIYLLYWLPSCLCATVDVLVVRSDNAIVLSTIITIITFTTHHFHFLLKLIRSTNPSHHRLLIAPTSDQLVWLQGLSRCFFWFLTLNSFFSSAGWAIYISWSKCCLSVCVWMLTRVAQIITAVHRDLWSCVHKRNEFSSYTKN